MAPSTAFHHGLIGLFNIDAWDFGEDGICQHRDGVVADHAVIVLSPEVPNGQIAVSLVVQHHIFHKLCGDVRSNQRIEWMSGAESVPKAKSAVVSLPGRHLFDFKVSIHVTAVHIAHGIGLHQNMVQARVENGLLLVSTLHVDTAEFTLPSLMGGLNIVVKIPAWGFG